MDESFYPFEMVIAGTPVSLQAKRAASRQQWKERVSRIARDQLRRIDQFVFLDRRAISISIFYLPRSSVTGDIDNIVKPILDALVGIVYLDDEVVERVLVQKFEPEGGWSFSRPSDRLASVLESSPPLVYVRIDDDLTWRTL